MNKYIIIIVVGVATVPLILWASPGAEPDKVLLSVGTLIMSVMTFISSRENASAVKETKQVIEKTKAVLEETAHAVNGVLTGRVEAAGELGELRGRDKERDAHKWEGAE